MNEFDLSLYGNIILDSVHCVYNFKQNCTNEIINKYCAVGAIGNALRELDCLDSNLNISINSAVGDDLEGKHILKYLDRFKIEKNIEICANSPTSTATIISDVKLNTRTSLVNWGACTKSIPSEIKDSTWYHIMYLDTLTSLSKSELIKMSQNGIVSLDLCLDVYPLARKKWIISILKYVDYLIISDTEARSLMSIFDKFNSKADCAKHLGSKVKESCIIHTPAGSTVSDGEALTVFTANIHHDKNLNVLSAGDIFASSFIFYMLKNNDLNDSIKFAHKNTTQRIKDRKAGE